MYLSSPLLSSLASDNYSSYATPKFPQYFIASRYEPIGDGNCNMDIGAYTPVSRRVRVRLNHENDGSVSKMSSSRVLSLACIQLLSSILSSILRIQSFSQTTTHTISGSRTPTYNSHPR